MSRRFVLKGDKTEHDGVVLDGIAGSSLDGRPLAYLGAPVFCYTVQHGRRHPRRWLASHDGDNGQAGRSGKRPVSVQMRPTAEAGRVPNRGDCIRLKYGLLLKHGLMKQSVRNTLKQRFFGAYLMLLWSRTRRPALKVKDSCHQPRQHQYGQNQVPACAKSQN
jgi:hypothetical protein